MRTTLIATVTAAVLVLPGAAMADDMYSHNNPGMYFGLGGGLNLLESDGVSNSPFEASYDEGGAGLLTFGYRFRNGIRMEMEGGYRHNGTDSVDAFGTEIGDNGFREQWSLMGNVLYDFQLGSWFSPYAGAGIGVVNHKGGGDVSFGGPDVRYDYDGTGFAWQLIAGASAQLGGGLETFVDYRYLSAPDLDVEAGGFSEEVSANNHTFMVGLRYAFWSPEPAMATPQPEPVAQPAPEKEMAPQVEARSYLVFFDWDSDALTDEARGVIRAAADNIKRGGVSTLKVQVTGHADRSGSSAYNVGLSERRAEAVRDALVAMGVSNGTIGVDWKGEADPLVQTEDGVREPQNRRASIEVAT